MYTIESGRLDVALRTHTVVNALFSYNFSQSEMGVFSEKC